MTHTENDLYIALVSPCNCMRAFVFVRNGGNCMAHSYVCVVWCSVCVSDCIYEYMDILMFLCACVRVYSCRTLKLNFRMFLFVSRFRLLCVTTFCVEL